MTDSDKKYVHAYDYMGRRVRTRVYTWDTQQSQWETTPDEDQRFMYHGRQRILTLSGSGADDELFKFVWGPDPSPKRERGVVLGQLLAMADDPNSVDYIAFHDGMGNLGQIAKRSDGSLVAKYDFNGRVRAAVIGECEDPNSLDDCDQCAPCFFGYGVSGNWFYLICGCGPGHDDPGTGCAGTGCGWGPDLDPGGGGDAGDGEGNDYPGELVVGCCINPFCSTTCGAYGPWSAPAWTLDKSTPSTGNFHCKYNFERTRTRRCCRTSCFLVFCTTTSCWLDSDTTVIRSRTCTLQSPGACPPLPPC